MNDIEKPLLSERVKKACAISWDWFCEHWAMVVCCILVCAVIGLTVFGVVAGIRENREAEAAADTGSAIDRYANWKDEVAVVIESEPTEPIDIPETSEATEATEVIEETEPTIEVSEPVIEKTEPPVTNPPEMPSETVEAPETTEPEVDVGLTDAEMLAIVIYQEVGGNACCDACRYRVGDIVLNRVVDPRFPNTIYDVLMQPGQYGRLSWTGIVWADRASNPNEAHAVERARNVANDILNGNHSDLYGNGYVWQAGFAQGTDRFWCCGHFYGRG